MKLQNNFILYQLDWNEIRSQWQILIRKDLIGFLANRNQIKLTDIFSSTCYIRSFQARYKPRQPHRRGLKLFLSFYLHFSVDPSVGQNTASDVITI